MSSSALFLGLLVAMSSLGDTASAETPFRPSPQWLQNLLGVQQLPTDIIALKSLAVSAIDQFTSDVRNNPKGLLQRLMNIDWTHILHQTDVLHSYRHLGENVDIPIDDLADERSEYPYFRFMPDVVGSVKADGNKVSWESPCFTANTASASLSEDGKSVQVTIEANKASSLFCSDTYLFATRGGYHFSMFSLHGEHRFTWAIPSSDKDDDNALLWDLMHNGVRIMRFIESPVYFLESLARTVELFRQPLANVHVDEATAKMNVEFLQKYTNIADGMKKRANQVVNIDEAEIESGDFFGIARLDGLDPMLGWAMGSTTGHTAVALRDPDTNELFVCESTAATSYWDVNGIQKTPFQPWVQKAQRASFHVVWVPIAPEIRAKLDLKKAWAFFHENEGFDYGYHNMLFPWIDTAKSNYPCLPPHFKTCLQFEHMEILASLVDMIAPEIGDRMFKQAIALRVGSSSEKSVAELLRLADLKNMKESLLTQVELDSYVYNTTRYNKPARGSAMVCCMFVCRVWKAAGVFGDLADSINCNEFTNWDVYSLKVFDSSRLQEGRLQACRDADPTNAACQLLGSYSLQLNGLNTKPFHSHMAETCPSQNPFYPHRDVC